MKRKILELAMKHVHFLFLFEVLSPDPDCRRLLGSVGWPFGFCSDLPSLKHLTTAWFVPPCNQWRITPISRIMRCACWLETDTLSVPDLSVSTGNRPDCLMFSHCSNPRPLKWLSTTHLTVLSIWDIIGVEMFLTMLLISIVLDDNNLAGGHACSRCEGWWSASPLTPRLDLIGKLLHLCLLPWPRSLHYN